MRDNFALAFYRLINAKKRPVLQVSDSVKYCKAITAAGRDDLTGCINCSITSSTDSQVRTQFMFP